MTYTFFWSPEGRKLFTVKAASIKEAKAVLRKQFPQHAKYMGEIYIERKEDHVERG